MDTKRFNKPEYKNQIRSLRNYKRQVPLLPEGKAGLVLQYIGLGTLKRQILAVLILAGLIYIIYFAKFLDLQNPQIIGADAQLQSEIQQNLADYGKHFAGIFPQKNILFFSKAGFAQYLAANNYKVAKVDQIKERLWNHIQITVEQRVAAYALQNNGNYFILNSDSTIGLQIPADQAAQYLEVNDTAQEDIHPGDKFFTDQQNSFLAYINSNAQPKLGLEIGGYEVPGKASDQLTVLFKKGFAVYFTNTADPADDLDKLNKLWLQFSPQQQDSLAYVDLRFNKNAYVCFKGTACAQ